MNDTHWDTGLDREKSGASMLPPIKPSDEPAIAQGLGLGLSPAASRQGLAPHSQHSTDKGSDSDKDKDKGSGLKKKAPSQAANRARLVSDVLAKAQGPVTKDPSYALQVVHNHNHKHTAYQCTTTNTLS